MKHGECIALVRHIFIVTKTTSAVHGDRLYVFGCEIPSMFAMPAACGSAQHVQTQSVVIHAHLLQRNCAKDKSGSFLVHVDDHALIRSLSHTLTLF